MSESVFRFRHFSLRNEKSPAKVGTDGVLLGAWAGYPCRGFKPPTSILDIGTGTGLIAVMMAQRFPQAKITAIENDGPSFQEAAQNFLECPWRERLEVIHADFFDWALLMTGNFDLVVSNPPFFVDGTQPAQATRRSWRHNENFVPEKMFLPVSLNMNPGGRFAMILPAEESKTWETSAEKFGFNLCRKLSVRSKKDKEISRVLLEWSNAPCKAEVSEIYIQEEGTNQYSAEYIALTRDFYPWM